MDEQLLLWKLASKSRLKVYVSKEEQGLQSHGKFFLNNKCDLYLLNINLKRFWKSLIFEIYRRIIWGRTLNDGRLSVWAESFIFHGTLRDDVALTQSFRSVTMRLRVIVQLLLSVTFSSLENTRSAVDTSATVGGQRDVRASRTRATRFIMARYRGVGIVKELLPRVEWSFPK